MPADLDALVTLMPFAGHLGLVVDEADPDLVIMRLTWPPHLCTAGDIMHGGVLMSLADTAGALVTYLGLPEGATTATITSTSQMFWPVSITANNMQNRKICVVPAAPLGRPPGAPSWRSARLGPVGRKTDGIASCPKGSCPRGT
jgi:uncharacterized protein (TIGR00369 family)